MRFGTLWLFGMAVMPICTGLAQDTVILRDLSVVKGSIKTLDSKKIEFADGRRLEWRDALSSNVAEPLKSQFQQFVAEKGLPLFHAEQKLRLQELVGLGELAETLFRQLASEPDRFSDGEGFLISVAAMKSRVASGDRANAVLPFLKATELFRQKKVARERVEQLGVSPTDLQAGVAVSIWPVWFDRANSTAAVKDLQATLASDISKNSSGLLYYLASLHLYLNSADKAKPLIEELNGRKLPVGWMEILKTQFDIAEGRNVSAVSRLQNELTNFPYKLRMAANFVVGSELGKDPQNADLAVLKLLEIPASEKESEFAMGSAALYESINILKKTGQTREVVTLQNELLSRFPNTYHGRLLKLQLTK